MTTPCHSVEKRKLKHPALSSGYLLNIEAFVKRHFDTV